MKRTHRKVEDTGQVIDVQRSIRWPARLRLLLFMIWMTFGVFQLGTQSLDHRLARWCWSVSNLWNTVAKVAVQSGAVDGHIDGERATVQHASVHSLANSRYAIVTVSDWQRSEISILDWDYRVMGRFRRRTEDATMVKQKWRGFQPLTHLWPVYDAHSAGRLETLIGFAPIHSAKVALGRYAYVALGSEQHELLFVCDIDTGPRIPAVLIGIDDNNNDRYEDIVVQEVTKTDKRKMVGKKPLVVFEWDEMQKCFVPKVSQETSFIRYWCSSPSDREYVPIDTWIDKTMVDRLLNKAGTPVLNKAGTPGRSD